MPTGAAAWAVVALVGARVGWVLGAGAPRDAAVRAALLVTVAVAGVAAVAGRAGRAPRTTALALVLVAATCLGLTHRALLADGPLDRLATEGGSATLVGVVVADVRPTEPGRWWTIVRIDRVGDTRTRERAVWSSGGDPPRRGQTVDLQASARPLDEERAFDGYLRRLGVVARLSVSGTTVSADEGALIRSTNHVRDRVRNAAARGLAGDRAGLAVGLVTGDTSLLSAATEERMRDAGLTHLVAVSGSNVAVVVAGVAMACGLLGIGRRGRTLAMVVALAWFALLTRAEPSVLRASVMAGAVLVAQWRGVPGSSVHALAVAVLVLVLVDPALAGSLGLLLSAGATAGVLVLAPLVARRLSMVPGRLRTVLAVTLGAQVAVAPLLVGTTGAVPLGSVPANLVAVPAAGVASLVVGVASVLAVVHVGAAGALMALADPPLRVVLAAGGFGGWPVVSPARPGLVVGAVAGSVWLLTRPGSRVGAAAIAVAMGASTTLVAIGHAPPAALTVTMIDVGQGDAILVEADPVRILVDGGPDRSAADWLRREGIDRLDLVVLTHPHADHADGLVDVLGAVAVGAFWWRPVPNDLASMGALERELAARAIPVHEPVAGQVARVGPLTLHVLAPERGRPWAGADDELNESSIVLRVDQGARRALLTGDAEEGAQAALLRTPSALAAGLLKVPHHGGATSDPAFLAAVGASEAVIGVGRDNGYGHPTDLVLDLLAAMGTTVHRTDTDGTVRVTVPPVGGETSADPAALRSPHASRPPHRRRRRPAGPAGDGASVGLADRRRPRAGGRGPRREPDRAAARAAHPVAVRRPGLRGRARRPGAQVHPVGRPEG